MPEKVDFENYDSILNNFDAFCDTFENKALEAFTKGDADNGAIIRETTETLGGIGRASETIRETDNNVQTPECE